MKEVIQNCKNCMSEMGKGDTKDMKFEYFTGREVASNCYFIIPKALQTDPELRKLSVYAKYLYGLMLDKMKLSAKNNQVDKDGRVFIYYSTENIQKDLGIGRNTVFKLLDELDSDGGVGLIERIKLGQGRTSRIYVMRIVEAKQELAEDEYADDDVQKFTSWDSEEKEDVPEVQNVNFKKFKNGTSRSPKSNTLEVYDQDANKNNINKNINNNLIHIYPCSSKNPKMDGMRLNLDEKASRQIVREDMGTDSLCEMYPTEEAVIRGLENLIVDVLTSTRPKMLIGGDERGIDSVKSRFMSLTQFHIETVLANWNKLTKKPTNSRQYLLAMLYNVSTTADAELQAQINEDMANGVWNKKDDFEELMEG